MSYLKRLLRARAVVCFLVLGAVATTTSVAFEGSAIAADKAHADDGDHSAHHEKPAEPQSLRNSKYVAPLFWIFALLTIGGALFVITRRNLISAVLGMVGSFFAIAALYTMLFAHFLAVIQILVYAGAIMVLFVFVIMILNRPVEDAWSRQGLLGIGITSLSGLYILYRIASVLWSVQPKNPHADLAPGISLKDLAFTLAQGDQAAGKFLESQPAVEFGSTASVGGVLFDQHLFAFEAISLVLLVAVVGAIAVARPHENRETLIDDDDVNPADDAALATEQSA